MPIKVDLNDPIQARLHENAITLKNAKIRIFRKKLNYVHPLTIPQQNNVPAFKTGTTRTMPSKH